MYFFVQAEDGIRDLIVPGVRTCALPISDHLYVVGRLHGLPPAKPDIARVLEVGCGTGGNLLPMAATLPLGRFMGIDLSERKIEIAQAGARAGGGGRRDCGVRPGGRTYPRSTGGRMDDRGGLPIAALRKATVSLAVDAGKALAAVCRTGFQWSPSRGIIHNGSEGVRWPWRTVLPS